MPTHEGNIRKMRAQLAEPVHYALPLSEQLVDMNELIGQEISLRFDGQINCINCGRLTKKSYSGGFCYPCMIKSPQNSECIIRPELCRAHLGEGRDAEWERKHHLQPHVVYLAQTDAIKVGVTRDTQVPTRWIDQGARRAVAIAEVPYRFLAGQIEVVLKSHFTDKTNWRSMLTDKTNNTLDITKFKTTVAHQLPEDLQEYYQKDAPIINIQYPVEQYPAKVKSIKLEKIPEVSGRLTGIRGQYLMFGDGRVLNVRTHSGYYVTLSIN